MDGSVSFVVPVQPPRSVANWPAFKATLAVTLGSIAAQTGGNWRGIVVANVGADLPAMPSRFEVVRVDPPYLPMPDRKLDEEAFYEALREEKGGRIFAALMQHRPSGHVMVVDSDDLVSNRVAAFVAERPCANGWLLDSGYLFSGPGLFYLRPRGFSELCGTSHIVRGDLLDLPEQAEAATLPYIRRTFGSHRYIEEDLSRRGAALARLPFAGAAYRLGHATSVTRSSGLLQRIFPRADLLRRPHIALARTTRLRLPTPRLRAEFFGGSRTL